MSKDSGKKGFAANQGLPRATTDHQKSQIRVVLSLENLVIQSSESDYVNTDGISSK